MLGSIRPGKDESVTIDAGENDQSDDDEREQHARLVNDIRYNVARHVSLSGSDAAQVNLGHAESEKEKKDRVGRREGGCKSNTRRSHQSILLARASGRQFYESGGIVVPLVAGRL